jgi:transposase
MNNRQLEAIKLLANGLSNSAVAEQVGITEQYLSKLKKEKDFSLILALACIDRVKGLLPDSINKLSEIIKQQDPELYDTQLKAIKLVFDYSSLLEIGNDIKDDNGLVIEVKYD